MRDSECFVLMNATKGSNGATGERAIVSDCDQVLPQKWQKSKRDDSLFAMVFLSA